MFLDLHYGMKNVTFQWNAVGCKVVVTTNVILKQKFNKDTVTQTASIIIKQKKAQHSNKKKH